MLNLCWSNTKRFWSVLVVFRKYFVFTKIVKISKIVLPCFGDSVVGLSSRMASVANITQKVFATHWWVNVLVAKNTQNIFQNLGFYVSCSSVWRLVHGWKVQLRGVHRDFRGLPRDFLASRPSSHEKNLENFSNCFLVFWWLALATCMQLDLVEKSHVLHFKGRFQNFLVFPRTFVTVHCLPHFNSLSNSPCLSQKLHFSSTSQHQSSRKDIGFLILT